jgi:hypothetical protein
LAGYSRTPLAKKLGIRAGDEIAVLDAPFDYLGKIDLAPAPLRLVDEPGAGTAITHLFTARRARLAEVLAQCRECMDPAAVVWVSWPKKASKLPSEVTEDTVRELALPLGYVDVKVCAVDETWSGLKLVVRKALR